jgi:protein tyrosine phosphatase
MSGLPYTSLTDTDSGTIVGNFNDSRYIAYHKLDLKIAKGFSIKEAKGHFYFEIWSAMNSPNMFQLDSKTNNFITMSTNLPTTALFVGVDCSY